MCEILQEVMGKRGKACPCIKDSITGSSREMEKESYASTYGRRRGPLHPLPDALPMSQEAGGG